MLKEILNKLIYIDILVKLLFPTTILSNCLLSAAIFDCMLKESIDVCTVCTWQNKFQQLLSISKIYSLESEQIKRLFSVRSLRAAEGKILWLYRVVL